MGPHGERGDLPPQHMREGLPRHEELREGVRGRGGAAGGAWAREAVRASVRCMCPVHSCLHLSPL